MTHAEALDLGHDLEITKTTRRASGSGTWISWTLSGHRFEALVFPEHADNPNGRSATAASRSSGFSGLADKREVFNRVCRWKRFGCFADDRTWLGRCDRRAPVHPPATQRTAEFGNLTLRVVGRPCEGSG